MTFEALASVTNVEDVARARRRLGPDATPGQVLAALDQAGGAHGQLSLAHAADELTSAADAEAAVAPDRLLTAAEGGGMPHRLRHSWPHGGPLWIWHRQQVGLTSALARDAGTRPIVGIVGTRRPTADGLRLAEQIAADLAGAGVEIVSGFARGIDQAAHRGALEAGGITTAVLGTGLDVDYPGGCGTLRQAIVASGGLVTEHPHGTGVRHPKQFLARNRILAGLCDAVVVIEAGRRSGALNTAGWAGDMGREVMAVPCSPSTPQGAGALGLLRDGATCVTSAADVLAALGWCRTSGGASPRTPEGAESLSPTAQAVHDLLGPVPTPLTALGQQASLDPPAVMAAVGELTAAGLATRRGGGVVRT